MPTMRAFPAFAISDFYQLLQSLSSYTALVYLQDEHYPTIAFLPEDYWKIQGNSAYYYQRQQDLNYQCQQTIPLQHAHTAIQTWQRYTQYTETSTQLTGFTGGYIGFVSYDDGANFHLKQAINKKVQISTFMGCYRSFIRLEAQHAIFYSDEEIGERLYQQLLKHLQYPKKPTPLQLTAPCQARWSKQDYQIAFQKVQDYIKAGDCYQINLTQEFTAQANGDLLSIAPQLWQLTQAPFAGYLQLDDFELLSCSPELFIAWQTPQHIITRPIKGTMPRHTNPEIDAQHRQILQQSSKDQAENVMIVDLLRNDFSIYAQLGSVKTTKLFEIESFNQVHHLVSEIQATIPQMHPFQVLMMALPGGSITGAPKIRAMQIIDELEQNPRGAYCGSLGYFNFNGTGRWNILIRTIQKSAQNLSIWAGGGITIASQLDAEYQECFDKVGSMLNLVNQFTSSNLSD